MSHRLPPDDRDPIWAFLGLLGALLAVLGGVWWIVFATLA